MYEKSTCSLHYLAKDTSALFLLFLINICSKITSILIIEELLASVVPSSVGITAMCERPTPHSG